MGTKGGEDVYFLHGVMRYKDEVGVGGYRKRKDKDNSLSGTEKEKKKTILVSS